MAELMLAPRLDMAAARPLAEALRGHRGGALTIDAGGVQCVGGLCLQLLLAGARDWRDAGLPLAFSARSAAFDEAIALFGLSLDQLQTKETS